MLYEFVLLIHIAAAVALLSGSVIGSPAVRAAVRRAATTAELRAFVAIGRPLLVVEPAAAGFVLASGVYLTSVANFWTLGWVQVSVAFWLVNAMVAAIMVKPAIGRVAAEASRAQDGPVGPTLDALRRAPRWSIGGDALLATDAAMLYLMVMKPELVGALLVVLAANVTIVAARGVRRGFAAPRPAGI